MANSTDLNSEFYGVYIEPELHKKIQQQMKEKGYKNKSEYIRAAIRFFNKENEWR